MTKQELIDHLQHLEQYTHYSEDAPALREVIEMLTEERTEERMETHACDLIDRRSAIDLFPNDDLESDTKGAYIAPHLARQMICELPSAQPEQYEIGYYECVNVMLKMWNNNVLTNGEYKHIMDKLNAHWAERREE